jgi:vacuolar protein-sorting-associated protein 4
MDWRRVPAHKLLEPPLLAEDIFAVLKNFKSSVSREDVEKAKEWTEEFGSEGA